MTLQVLEFIARHTDGQELRHRSTRERIEVIANELRREGWTITWLPVATPPALAGPSKAERKAERREQRLQVRELGAAA